MLLPAPDRLAAFERNLARSRPVDHRRNLVVAEALFVHARALGALPGPDPLAGIDTDIRLARVLNVRTAPRRPRPRS